MKKAIFYTVTKRFMEGFVVLSVTSRQARKTYGRFLDQCTTHVRTIDCYGKFSKIEEAIKIVEKLERVEKEHTEARRPYETALAELDYKRRKEIDAILKEANSES